MSIFLQDHEKTSLMIVINSDPDFYPNLRGLIRCEEVAHTDQLPPLETYMD